MLTVPLSFIHSYNYEMKNRVSEYIVIVLFSTFQSSFKVVWGGAGVVSEECVHGHHHTRGTETAL